jgi:hypothetical protein
MIFKYGMHFFVEVKPYRDAIPSPDPTAIYIMAIQTDQKIP